MCMGNQLENSQKCVISQNWLGTHKKVINAQNKLVIHYTGGMLALNSGLCFCVTASEVPFFCSWKWALLPKLPVLQWPKITVQTPNQKSRNHFLLPTSTNMMDYMFVLCVYHFIVGFKQILKYNTFLAVFELISHRHGRKTKSANIFLFMGL